MSTWRADMQTAELVELVQLWPGYVVRGVPTAVPNRSSSLFRSPYMAQKYFSRPGKIWSSSPAPGIKSGKTKIETRVHTQ